MEAITGTPLPVFIGITLLLVGFAAFMTGQALANTWRPPWMALPYALLLGLADRFLGWGLFDGALFSPLGYLIDTAVLLAIAVAAYRLTLSRKMSTQYPWLYERAGLFSWREKTGG